MVITVDSAKEYERLLRGWKRGATITNKKLTSEGRSTAAKKGWRDRKKRIKAGIT